MNKGILASQLSFRRGATPLEFLFALGSDGPQGVVKRTGRGKGAQWIVEDAPDCTGFTREDAVTKYLTGVKFPVVVFHHRWVSTTNGPMGMRYACDKTGETYNKTEFGLSQVCLGCGETVSFDQRYAETHSYTLEKGVWVLGRSKS